MMWRVVMLRKLAIFMLLAGLTVLPVAVHALGFGGIKLKSALYEKLDSEVALSSATANDIQSLKISLASDEAYLRSGIDRTAILNKLDFKIKKRANGDYYIHVTSKEVIREPYMNFLLEMNWKNGRMLREYTMLIDPPGRATKQFSAPAPVIAETAAAESAPVPVLKPARVEEPAPVVDLNTPIEEPVTPFAEEVPSDKVVFESPDEVAVGGLIGTEEPAPVVELLDETETIEVTGAMSEDINAPFVPDDAWPRIPLSAYTGEDEEVVAQLDAPEEVASGGEMGDLDYGITRKNDNLWKIAEKLRRGDESISVYQMMIALLQSNPDAFVDNNVHRLKVGHVIRITDPSVLTSNTRKQAANLYIKQTESWNNTKQLLSKKTNLQPIIVGESTPGKTAAKSKPSGELTLASPDGAALSAGGSANQESLNNDLATMQDQLRQAKKDAGTMRTRNVALNDKLQALEDEFNRLQRSLTIKDDELAALQKKLSDLNKQPAPVTTKAIKPTVAPPAVEKKIAAKEAIKKPVKPPKPPVEQAVEILLDENAATGATDTLAEPGIMDTIMDIIDIIMGVLAPIIANTTEIVSGLNLNLDSTTLLYVAAPIVLVFLIIMIVFIRRRRQRNNFEESILTGAASAAPNSNGSLGVDSSTFSEESSFLSDFAMSGASAIQADDSEVDPLTEADVFMAYGRYEAAEERLNEAVKNEPGRMELLAKLLELHHVTQNKNAFEAVAEDLYAGLAGNEAGNSLWNKVVSMGSEIAPANPLFSQGEMTTNTTSGKNPAFDDPGMGMTDSQVMDIGLETGVFEAAEFAGSTDSGMDFNLDFDASTASEESASDFDFNLDMGTTESAKTDDAGLDFNLDIGGDETADAGLDFNLDIGGGEETADAGLDFNTDGLLDELSLDMDSNSDSPGMDLNLDASDMADDGMGGGDEVGTKLDLAKAYIDMGDPEGARSILDEVMDEGSSTQKEEAQSLIGQIA